MKFSAVKRGGGAAAQVLSECSWDDLNQMERLKVQIYVDLAYLQLEI